jgi:hypothetical protein
MENLVHNTSESESQNLSKEDSKSVHSDELEDAEDIETPKLNPEQLNKLLGDLMKLSPDERMKFMSGLLGNDKINPNKKQFGSISKKEMIRQRLQKKLKERTLLQNSNKFDDLSQAEKMLVEADSDCDEDSKNSLDDNGENDEKKADDKTVSKTTLKNRKKNARKRAALKAKKQQNCENKQDVPIPALEVSNEL